MSAKGLPVRIEQPPGARACNKHPHYEWLFARDQRGAAPFYEDLNFLKRRFPTEHSHDVYLEMVHKHMKLAEEGRLAEELVEKMAVAPDVLEIRMPKWMFTGGQMLVRLYFSEPVELPQTLVGLRLKTKRPGPLGLDEQTQIAEDAATLLREFRDRGFQ